VGEQQFESITLRAYHGQAESELYEDAGEGYGYQEEAYCLRNFRTLTKEGSFELHQSLSGQYDTGYTSLRLQLFGLPFTPSDCTCDGENVSTNKTDSGVEIEVPAGFRRLVVKG